MCRGRRLSFHSLPLAASEISLSSSLSTADWVLIDTSLLCEASCAPSPRCLVSLGDGNPGLNSSQISGRYSLLSEPLAWSAIWTDRDPEVVRVKDV